MAMTPRQVTGEGKHWRAMSHPLRREMLRQLSEHGPANSTTLAEILGESTGTTSYHLRVLADAGVIEEVQNCSNGRERWWRTCTIRQHDQWAGASRSHAYFTADELESLFSEYLALLAKYGHAAADAPPGARPVQVRMFYVPDDDAPAAADGPGDI
jgi:DNA-binding transcriptional ArsR family regulator